MMESYRKGIVSFLEEDRISNLPEHLVDSILERVPLEEAVRTSILSKKWRYKWTRMMSLVLDEHFSDKITKNGDFGRIINKVMILHLGPISKFVLHIPNISLDSFEEVDQWILRLSRNGVKKLTLTNYSQCYDLPSYFFSCLQLTKLNLKKCRFKPPLEFQGFLNLKDLDLRFIDFGPNLCGNQIDLPQLKNLELHSCINVHNFNIKATNLRRLIVFFCLDVMLLPLLDSPCLTVVWISFQKPLQDFVPLENLNFATLSNLPKIKTLLINSQFIKILAAEKIPKLLPCEISSLRELCLVEYQLGDLDQLHGALCLLRNSPNLESLQMIMEVDPQVDEGPASNLLESPNCLDCTLNRLQTVEITDLEGSKPELLFIKLLLAHSPFLEEFTITPSDTSDARKIAKYLMQFPRASPKAEMFYLDP